MLEKHSINIAGHKTSISLEPEFWQELKNICEIENKTIRKIITEIDETSMDNNLSSKIRIFVLKKIKELL
ncbi:MAG: ribbon-helix-helix domain-containing protein [Alphaproteobacteria bacterium]|jgi:predicted DNA-binding ribbon-helix-helix protein|nr:ribbon-helix-helix domain-containing protein [Alphaproteobacteria bacterium]MBQ8660085.1 ribbon-helix-helix domain-containing protein [Alphaproteobacteria bacterium]MBR4316925.1 ribbon-helix-helix domain-containing protein [Alphaproteobacteria bacterium]